MNTQKAFGKICFGLMALTSFSVVAQEASLRKFDIQNLTYPEKTMSVECEDQSCSLLKITVRHTDAFESYYSVKKSTIEDTSINKRSKGTSARFYGTTADAAELTSKRYDEAYYGKAIGNGIVTGLAAILDTVALPVDLIESLVSKNSMDSGKDKRGARRILGNLNSSIKKVVIKHKYYEQISDYVDVSFPYAQTDEEYKLLLDFNSGKYEGCSMDYNYNYRHLTHVSVDGRSYTDKNHRRDYGYNKRSDLVGTLRDLVEDERCVKK